jgi:Matrixin
MKKLFLLTLLLTSTAQAFILIHPTYKLKDPKNVKLKISSEGCDAAGVSRAELKDALEATADIWNDVPDSKLRIKEAGTSGTSITSSTIPSSEIIVGCGPLDASIAGVANPDIANGSARVTLNDSVYNGSHSKADLIGTLIHEVGHGIGLNHSKDPASVMTYEANGWGARPTYLSQDDMDGVVYLYPNDKEAGGLVGSCSSFASDGHQSGNFFFDFLLGVLGILVSSMIVKKFLRKTRAVD